MSDRIGSMEKIARVNNWYIFDSVADVFIVSNRKTGTLSNIPPSDRLAYKKLISEVRIIRTGQTTRAMTAVGARPGAISLVPNIPSPP